MLAYHPICKNLNYTMAVDTCPNKAILFIQDAYQLTLQLIYNCNEICCCTK